jgi:hypothetical protein
VFLNPFTIIKKTGKIIREISLYFFYREQLGKMGKSDELENYNMYRDVFGGLYTVVNMQPELKMYNNEKDLEREEKMIVANEMSKALPLFEKYDIYELVRMKTTRINTELKYGYGIVIKFVWRELTFWWLVWIAMFYTAIGFLVNYLITLI